MKKIEVESIPMCCGKEMFIEGGDTGYGTYEEGWNCEECDKVILLHTECQGW